jgi:hypothetical protein
MQCILFSKGVCYASFLQLSEEDRFRPSKMEERICLSEDFRSCPVYLAHLDVLKTKQR